MSEILKEEQQRYLDSFLKASSGVIASMEEFAALKGIPILGRHSSEFLNILIKIKNPMAVLEIGTAIGYSAIKIALALSEGAKLDTIEKSTPNILLAQEYIRQSGLDSRINLIQGDALDILKNHTSMYDLIFLDADKEDYRALFDLSLPLLQPRGIMVIDNLLWHGYSASKDVPEKFQRSAQIIRDFNNYFMNLDGVETAIIPVGDGIGLVSKI